MNGRGLRSHGLQKFDRAMTNGLVIPPSIEPKKSREEYRKEREEEVLQDLLRGQYERVPSESSR